MYISKPEQYFNELDGKRKWDVNTMLARADSSAFVKADNGYFGSYTLIEYKGMECVVFCDDRDAIVHCVSGFFDKIYYDKSNSWSGDHRWNYDKPLVVYRKRKGYNLIAPHSNKLLCAEWLKRKIDPHWYYIKGIGDVLYGFSNGEVGHRIYITGDGSIHDALMDSPAKLQERLGKVKEYTVDQIQSEWIDKGMPCMHIRGLEYKGSRPKLITKEEATEYLKTHHSFDCRFESAEWSIINATVTLVFRDYANSDYD